MNIPMTDLKVQYRNLKQEMDCALIDVMDNAAFSLGPAVVAFERDFAAYVGTRHCLGLSNGTDAIKLALRGLGVGPGDEVICPLHTFGATVEAICEVGARPVLVDAEERYFTMNVAQIEEKITERTRAIIPVHIYGHPVDMEPLLALAQEHDLLVIEDAAQAHGARYKGRAAGTMGRAGCFSFYPGKNLGAYGEAGGITTDDGDLVETVRMLRDHGLRPGGKRFYYEAIGGNYRMDGFQGAVLNVKLPHLNAWNDLRRKHAAQYTRLLSRCGDIKAPEEAPWAHHVYHLYVIRVPDRDGLSEALAEAGVASSVQYPNPIHLTPAYAFLGYREGDFPVFEKLCSEILSLPMYPELTEAQVSFIADQIARFYSTVK